MSVNFYISSLRRKMHRWPEWLIELTVLTILFSLFFALFSVVEFSEQLIAWSESHEPYEALQVDEILPAMAASLLVFALWIANRHARQNIELSDLSLQHESILRSIGDGVLGIDSAGMVVFANDAAAELLRYDTVTGMIGFHHHEVLSGNLGGNTECLICTALRIHEDQLTSTPLVRHDGEEIFTDIIIETLSVAGARNGAVVTIRDITERKEHETQLREKQDFLDYLAHHDHLTALPNRLMLQEMLPQAIARAHRSGSAMAVLLLDLDHFKNINDSLGHESGDKVLIEVSNRLNGVLRDSDFVARLGGDEFIAVLENSTGEMAGRVAEKILRSMDAQIDLGTLQYTVTTSIGIAIYPYDATSSSDLMRCADSAMYRAKDSGRNNFAFFTSGIGDMITARLVLENELREAVKTNQLSLDYQPQFDVAKQKICGMESLVRWNHPQKGLISPMEFIPVAEETGLIVEIGQWVLHKACRTVSQWWQAGLEPVVVAVNLSARQFRDPGLLPLIEGILKQYRLPAELLELEITETTAAENVQEVIVILRQLKELGVSVAIDDFGTGYSSLAYLKQFKVDQIKIDRSFISDLPTSPEDCALTTAVLAMGQALGIKVIAEGVETEAQMAFLKNKGCQYIQGYLISKPLSAEEMRKLVTPYSQQQHQSL